ncbi:MAG: BMP family protein [Paracoccaceae bacterium]
MKIIKNLLGVAALVGAATIASAQGEVKPAIIFDLGGKFDKSFNEAAYRGAERFKEETGVAYDEFEMQNEAQREQALRRFASRGNNPIVVTGFAFASALDTVAAEFPDTNFAIIDMVVDQPNVRSVVFNEHEGSYLVGILAAMASKAKKVGFVGGMDIPLISKFACGYVQGVKSVDPSIEVFQNMTGTTPSAWNDPVKGGELTRAQIDQGADVVYHAAGGTGRGVLQAAADAGILGIGVDSNQNHLFPGSVLTSMLKRVDVAVYNAFKDSADGKFTTGFNVLGLAQDGVGWALDENNAPLISDEMKAAVEDAKAKIISGEIKVHDYMADSSCPVM